MAPKDKNNKLPPSSRWTSLENWDYNGMKERLESHFPALDTSVLKEHAEAVLGESMTLSTPFSAGQYWVCFELIAADGRLVIARVRLPRHPSLLASYTAEDERYQIECEVATMHYVRQKLPRVKIPRIYAYEPAGSPRAVAAGAAYMLIEGFYGNTLQDVEFDICQLPQSTQEHIITQWTRAQADIATLTLPCIGSIAAVTPQGEPVAGRLSTAKAEGLADAGPFLTTAAYFSMVADAAVSGLALADGNNKSGLSWEALGKLVFRDIVQTTGLYSDACQRFPLFHMDMGTQNILVDDAFNFLAVIDWEFAQTAPWAINYYPFPFPLLHTDTEVEERLQDTEHIGHANMARQDFSRKLYARKFREAEEALSLDAEGSFSATLDSAPSRIYACFTRLGDDPAADEHHVEVMVQLAFGYGGAKAKEYLASIKQGRTD
ncbi:hypothetical protein F503_02796 [Ophiostoma piceae UAMH 11346]|uniref:Aminoglycoside phosphotransferase domain-containing protein n=1 Tax=Ophiostoma piceae (strain UAMH 11346) TaxID=1262450 RepID=S3BZL1_OPHP1|nr:hypothetical protein F503_02796 [Ophiostoma piceae UAMH 11346]